MRRVFSWLSAERSEGIATTVDGVDTSDRTMHPSRAGRASAPSAARFTAWRILPVFAALVLAGFTGAPASAQVFSGQIDLDDSDPNNVPDSPAGMVVSPDGQFLIVCISGDPDFSPDPPDLNNNEVRVIDRATNTVVNTITTGLFPVECAVTTHGADAYLWVLNSSDNNVSVFRVANAEFDMPGSITEETFSPISTGAFSFPNGIAVHDDQNSVWVGTSGGTGEVFQYDADPLSGTYGTVLQTVLVSGATGRLGISGDDLIVPHSFFNFPLSDGRITVFDTTNPVDLTELVVTPTLDFNAGEFVSMIDVAVTSDGFGYVTVFGAGTGENVVVVDIANRTIARTVNLSGVLTEEQHGAGISPDGRFLAITTFMTHEVAIIDLEDDSIVTILDSPNDEPTEVVWSHDSCTLYVANQDANGFTSDSIGIITQFADRDLFLTGTTTPSIGDTVELTLVGGCEGRKGGILTSLSNAGGTFRGLPVPLGNPISVVEAGLFDVAGTIVGTPIAVPNDPALIGTSRYYMGGSKDPGGVVRLTPLHTVIYQP